jgi:putative thiamine transport system substrate-binding protein
MEATTFARRLFLLLPLVALGLSALPASAAPDPRDWNAVVAQARGQTVYFNAWGGEPRINAFIAGVGRDLESRFGIRLVHVKLGETAEAVSRVIAEKAAGNGDNGAVDLIWINGENFAALKRNGLLFGPWAEQLPNFPLTDPEANPALRSDFTVPVEGYEAPWLKAQIVFYHDAARTPEPPKSMPALLAWARANPGRFAYPLPSQFLGMSFVKQALTELTPDRGGLAKPVDEATFAALTAPLWTFLDALHPHLWRAGRAFPANAAQLRRLVADGETRIGFSFDPAEASAAIAAGDFPPTMRGYVHDGGTIGNISYLAIPFNARNAAGAMVLANLLLSPEMQARMQDPAIWGAATVLAVPGLPPTERRRFEALDLGPATLRPEQLGTPLPEPHPSWVARLEREWTRRYSAR